MKSCLLVIVVFFLILGCNSSPPPVPQYTVTFNTNKGSSVVNQKVEQNQKIKSPKAIPIREGFIFSGWYKDINLVIPFNFDKEKITNNTIIYARWEEQTYLVHFETNGGSDISPKTLKGKVIIGKTNAPVKENFDFRGWYRDPNFSSPFNLNIDKIIANTTLYAKWETSIYTVAFISNGGSLVSNQKITRGQFAKRPSNEPTKPNQEFIDWYADEQLEQIFDFKNQTITESTKVYAKWAKEAFFISFNTNGGNVLLRKKVAGGEPLIKSKMPIPKKSGYTFDSWYGERSLVVRYPFGAKEVTSNVVLYAKWLSKSKDITAFKFEKSKNPSITSDIHGVINGNLIVVRVPSNTNISALTPTIEFNGASIYFINGNVVSNPNKTVQDFTTTKNYIITAEDQTIKNYSIDVYNPTSNDLTRFEFTVEDNPTLNQNFVVQSPTHYFTIDMSGVSSLKLIPRLYHTGSRFIIADSFGNTLSSKTFIDFSNPIMFKIIARDNSVKTYILAIKNEASKDIISFNFTKDDNNTLSKDVEGKIMGHKITITLPIGADKKALTPSIFYTAKTIAPSNKVTDFTHPLTYTTTAKDGTSKTYTVEVQNQSEAKQILSFTLNPSNNNSLTEIIKGDITPQGNSYHIYLDVPFCLNIDQTSLTPTITHNGNSISPNNLTSQNFTNPVIYRVNALDGSTATYTVSIRSGQNYQDKHIVAVNNLLNKVGIKPSKINYIHVLENAPVNNCGESWKHAISGNKLAALVKGINDARLDNFYVILVGSGYFYPGTNRTSSFGLKNHIAIIGGWDGTDTYKLDSSIHKTIFSGSINNDFEKRAYHTFLNISVNNTSILYGITVTGSYANGNEKDGKGGGIYNEFASPNIINVDISNNYSVNRGAGMFNSIGSSPTLFNVTFHRNNSTNWSGGGMYNSKKSNPSLTNVTFSGNKAKFEGGGMYNERESYPTIVNTTFSENQAGNNGGGIYFTESSGRLFNCTLKDNKSAVGGGVYVVNSKIIILNSILWANIGGQLEIEGPQSQFITAHSINQSKNDLDPHLGSLAKNGGYVSTIAITANSSAINKGLYIQKSGDTFFFSQNNTSWYRDIELKTNALSLPNNSQNITELDARGFPRVLRPDIGAFEYKTN